jgi:hypothetical protein
MQTKVIDEGGQYPVWDEEFDHPFPISSLKDDVLF